MSYKLFPTLPTPQRVIEVLKRELGSCHYKIFGVSKRFRRTNGDFIAVARDNPCQFLLVRMAYPGAVVRPFGSRALLAERTVIEKMRYEDRQLAVLSGQIDLRRRNLKLEHFVPPAQHDELARLYAHVEYA